MRFLNSLLYRTDEDEPNDGLTHHERAIRRACEIGETPLYRLQEEITSFYRHWARAQIKLLVPQHVGRYDWDDYMTEGHNHFSFMEREELEEVLQRYEQRMMKGAGPREGSIKYLNHREVVIRPGNRRYPPHFTHQDIAEGIYYHQHTSPSPWHWHEPFPNFYPECIAPHLPKGGRTDPFGWALDRLKIVHGYGEEFCGHDNAPDYMEHPYKEMAARACNPLSDCLRLPRKYTLDDRRQALLKKVETLCPLPDAACIALENADSLTEAALDEPEVKLFFTELPRILENGFVLDRFTESVRAQRRSGLDAIAALRFASQLVCHMYRGQLIPLKPEEGGPFFDQKPWWFRENIDLTAMQDTEEQAQEREEKGECAIRFDDPGRELLLKIAEAGSFSAEYLLETYRTIGHKLAAMEGVGEDMAVDLCSEVVWEYGIGNPRRAVRTLEYAVLLAEETPAEQRAKVLEELFLGHVLRERPGTPIIAALEPEDASVTFPGLLPLLHSMLGKARTEQDQLLIANTRPDHVRELTALLYTTPQKKRACARIAFAAGTMHEYEQHRLLPQANAPTPKLKLPAPQEQKLLGGTTIAPFTGLLAFYKQLREECEGDYENAVLLYLSVCAPRMRDPLRPPKELLGLLQKYHSIPVVTLEDMNHDLFRNPFEVRRSSRSAQRRCDQAMTLSHLLDAMVMGALSEEELVETLRWLTVDAAPEEQKECCWNVHENGNEWRTGRIYYSQDDEGKEVAHVEERDEDMELNWRIRNAIGEIEGAARQKRLQALDGVLENCSVLTQISGRAGVPRQDVLSILHAGILKWKQGALPEFHDEGMESWMRNERINSLQICLDAGIIDCKALLKDIRQAIECGQSIVDLLDSLPGAAEALRRTNERITLFSNRLDMLTTPGRGDDRFALIRQELNWLRTELKREYWGGDIPVVYVLPDVVDRLIAATEVPAAMQLESAMRVVNEELLPAEPSAALLQSDVPTGAQTEGGQLSTQHVPDQISDILSATRGSLKSLPLLSIPVHSALASSRTRRYSRARLKEVQTGEHLLKPSPKVLALVRRYEAMLREQGPEMREQIRSWRMAGRGLLPVGGKVHVDEAFKEESVTLLSALVGENQYDAHSGFHLIHAARSLLLPPRPSVEEWETAIAVLIQQNAIKDRHPQLQVGLPGRIVPEHCGHLAVSSLLTTQWSARFTEDAFMSTHDHATGARMVAYDAGAPNAALPFMMRRGDANIQGRTDVLGRRHPEDARTIQLVGTALVDMQTGGPFAALGEEYIRRLEAILHHYGIAGVLNAPWVFRSDREKYDKSDAPHLAHFHEGVKPCQDLYFACAKHYQENVRQLGPEAPREGIIFDVRSNVDWLRQQVETLQPQVIDSDPRYREHLRYLLHV
ncbi:MAG: hypothetical protein PHE68_01310 [Candidatus Peribacteraceae bacterium]|nr:hypothetical protein [Candidatus Peribacteraceae bacterium]MDD5074574.1 hypothetical protein [Candidatus Peribacteraceae bacterium]